MLQKRLVLLFSVFLRLLAKSWDRKEIVGPLKHQFIVFCLEAKQNHMMACCYRSQQTHESDIKSSGNAFRTCSVSVTRGWPPESKCLTGISSWITSPFTVAERVVRSRARSPRPLTQSWRRKRQRAPTIVDSGRGGKAREWKNETRVRGRVEEWDATLN